MKLVRIGNGCGFWGDNLDAPRILAEQGRLDYLTLDYLAELTMSILARQIQRNPESGFAQDFLDVLERLTPVLRQQPNLRIVTNAGGMNPTGCAAKVRALLNQAGLSDRSIASVSGDDLRPNLGRLLQEGYPLENLESGAPLASVHSRVVSANAYLGARPIVEALSRGASIVITGRVADASLTLAPAVHELGWRWDDWDRLAAGTIAGHLIECGAQVTGGLWCNWQEAPDLANVGYPVAEIQEDGVFRITKPPGCGGAVNQETVIEQLLYEVGDPAAYLTPDVVADLTSVRVKEVAADTVEVTASRGRPAPDRYKVSIAYQDGFMAGGTLVLYGHLEADEKAQRCGEMLLERLRRVGVVPEHRLIECLGRGDCAVRMPDFMGCDEAVLRVTVRDSRREIVERFTKEFAPLVTSGPPGVTGYTTGRPSLREVLAYWPALIAKSAVTPLMQMIG